MKGSVRKKGATWSYRLDIGKVYGKRKQIERSGFKTKREAEAKLRAIIDEYQKTGTIIEDKKISLQEVFDKFIEDAEDSKRFSTILRYKSIYNNHFNDFAPKYLYLINSDEIQEFLNLKCKNHSSDYVLSMYKLFCNIFNYAIKKNFLRISPMKDVIAPKSSRIYGEIKTYTLEEISIMEERFKTTNLLPSFLLGINLGVRIGECFALRFSDIDWQNETIKIDKQLQYQNNTWSFISPKTINGNRVIKLNKKMVDYLKELQQKYKNDKLEYGLGYKINTVMERRELKNQKKDHLITVDDFINIKPNGEMLTPHSPKVLSRICKDELDINFKFHNLRHTHATMLAENGVNPEYVKDRLGHSNIKITLNYYTHITDKMHTKVAGIIDNMF